MFEAPTIWNTRPPLPDAPLLASVWSVLTAHPDDPAVLDAIGLLRPKHQGWLDTRVWYLERDSLRAVLHEMLLPLWVRNPTRTLYGRKATRHPSLRAGAPPDVVAALKEYRVAGVDGYPNLPGQIRYWPVSIRRDLTGLEYYVDVPWLFQQVKQIHQSPPPLHRARELLVRAGSALTLVDSRSASQTKKWHRVQTPKSIAARQALRRLYKLLPMVALWVKETDRSLAGIAWHEMPKLIKEWEETKRSRERRMKLARVDWE